MTKKIEFQPPPVIDLRVQGETNTTSIILHANYKSHAWIHAPGVTLTELGGATQQDIWLLEIRCRDATDFDHDAAIALRMALHGVSVHMAHRNKVWLNGFIDGNDLEKFRVPEPGWNQLAGATKCKRRDCKNHSHLVVDEGKYIPQPNLELFERLRGLRVGIVIGQES